MPNIERGPNIFEKKGEDLPEKEISKEKLRKELRNVLKKPEKFIHMLTGEFPKNKSELLKTIEKLRKDMPKTTDSKIVKTAILFEIIKENPGICQKDLATKSKFHVNTVLRYLKKLKEIELIKVGDFGKKGSLFESENFPGTLSGLILKILEEKEKSSLKELTQELSELLGRKIDRTTLMRRVRELESAGKIGVKERIVRGRTVIFLPEKGREIKNYLERVLEYIEENPGSSIRGIAQELGMGHSTVSKSVLGLLSEGKVVKFKMERGRSELYDKKLFEEVRKLGIEEPQEKEVKIFTLLLKYGVMPTLERIKSWTIKEIDNYLKKFLKPDEIGERLRRIAFEEDKTSLAILKKLKEIAPKDLKDKLNRIEKEVEKIKKTKPEESQKILGAIEKVKAASENKEEN